MKNITKKSKIIMIILAIVIMSGIVVVAKYGFNVDLRLKQNKSIELYIGKEFEISDIRDITNEVMPNEKVIIQKVEVFGDSVKITAQDITDEQKQKITEKINEKYELELIGDTVTTTPNARLRDTFLPYVTPFIVATALILVYMILRYIKINSLKVALKTLLYLVVSEATLISIIALARIPIGRYTISMIIGVYILNILVVTTKFEKELAKKKEEDKKK